MYEKTEEAEMVCGKKSMHSIFSYKISGGGHTNKILYVGIWRVFDVQVSFSNEGRDLGE